MKKSEIAIGDNLVVSALEDATMYEVVDISLDTNSVALAYDDVRGRYFAGWTDCSIMRKPTQAQLENYETRMEVKHE